ncbi:MAG: rRNA cytosine-C5-methyltransferase, partial [Rikenellaceae bacterium]|nr:rRNA cytosine-C5-methyltransferase [Rikenellaceae bacterium]
MAEALEGQAPVSVRLNPYKPYLLPESAVDGPVPWAEAGEAFYLAERPVFTADPVFHGGAYYVQEAASM